MDTLPLPHMLHGDGADWSTVDADDFDPTDLDNLTDEEKRELGLMPARPRYVPRKAPSWQTTDAEAEHLDQPHFASQFARVRWFAIQSLQRAIMLETDPVEASRLTMEAAAMEMMDEADLLIADIRNRDF
jgi:hypothetical protein